MLSLVGVVADLRQKLVHNALLAKWSFSVNGGACRPTHTCMIERKKQRKRERESERERKKEVVRIMFRFSLPALTDNHCYSHLLCAIIGLFTVVRLLNQMGSY